MEELSVIEQADDLGAKANSRVNVRSSRLCRCIATDRPIWGTIRPDHDGTRRHLWESSRGWTLRNSGVYDGWGRRDSNPHAVSRT